MIGSRMDLMLHLACIKSQRFCVQHSDMSEARQVGCNVSRMQSFGRHSDEDLCFVNITISETQQVSQYNR